MIEIGMVLTGLIAGPIVAPTPCKLVTNGEIASTLGVKADAGKAVDPDIDDELKAKSTACQFFLGSEKNQLLMVTVIEFDGAAAAEKGMDHIVKSAASNPDGVQVTAGSGVGERSLWGASDEGAMWAVRKGRQILSLAWGGIDIKPGAAREQLKRLTATALGRL